ncbi:MAG TPA: SIMPL domain-containing protein [Gemmatimonadaceae bacterium]|nr:SIMPL domain-containing protein [Gemmatimonadaceae bacterium]
MRLSVFGASIALASLAVAVPLRAQQPAAAPPVIGPLVEASAVGEARVTPDRALINLGVETRAPTAAAASRENARLQSAVIDTIRKLGIDRAQIATVDYSVYPEQVYDPQRGDRAPRITGYVVRNTVRVEVRKLDLVSSVIDAASAKGANGINSLQLFASNEAEVRRQALADAVGRARADAQAMAQAAGRCLGEIVSVTTVQSPVVPIIQARAKMAMAEQASTPVEAGEQTVSASVIGTWKLGPASGNCQ